MRLILIIISFLLFKETYCQKEENIIYEKVTNYLVDSILSSNQFDEKLKIYSNAETSKLKSSLLYCSYDALDFIDSVLIFKEIEMESNFGFWKENKPIHFILPKKIKKGGIRDFLCNTTKRSMTIFQYRSVGENRVIVIELSNKTEILGEAICIILDSKNDILKWCSTGWVR